MRVHCIRDVPAAATTEDSSGCHRSRRKELRQALKLVLASRSPRRAELLKAAGFEFTVRAADVDETPHEGEAPRDYVLRVAEDKARRERP